MGKEILITAAPGGHSGYAYAIGLRLRELGYKPVFLAAEGYDWIVKKLTRIGHVEYAPMPRRVGEPLYRSLHRWPAAFVKAFSKVKPEYRVLVSCGANLSIPPAIVSKLKGMYLVNVESIVRMSGPGKTPRFLHRIADLTLVHWPEQEKFLRGARVVGPIYEPPRFESSDGGYVLVTAGSVGFRELFDVVVEAGFERLVIQTGRVDPDAYKKRAWKVFDYDPDLERWIANASLVITHFPGMTSATAALAYKKPVVLVPAIHLTMSAPVTDCPLYSAKIGAVCINKLSPKAILEATDKARKVDKPSYTEGAMEAARLISRLYEG
ncbi:MAG: hypothetical protein F7C32_02060 [Desulfurococcales archaeon]|nr:hypothetical protein [Desulfurococcales archaeon]